MFSSKNILSMSVVALFATSAAFAQDSTTTTTTDSKTTKKESMGKKVEHVPGAAVKDTEKGVKAVGHGTKKVFTGTEHELGKVTHIGHKKKTTKTTDAAGNTSSTTTDSTSTTTDTTK
jgi:ERCC4-type nuclease